MLSRSSSEEDGPYRGGCATASLTSSADASAPEQPVLNSRARFREEEERLAELMRRGLSRSQAMIHMARENQEDELQELRESFEVVTALARVVLALEGWKCYLAATIWVSLGAVYLVWLLISFCFIILNVIGFMKTFLLVRCNHHRNLFIWMVLLQTALVVSAILYYIAENLEKRRPELAMVLRSYRIARGFWLFCEVCGLFLVTYWSLHARELVEHAAKPTGCARTLPTFIYWFSLALQVHKSGLFVLALAATPYKQLIALAARRGLLVTGRGAKTETVDKMQVVDFNTELFARPDDPNDVRAQGQCCICFDNFTAKRRIIRTPCLHFVHRRCLVMWMRASNTCPICRTSLEESEVLKAQECQCLEPL